MLFSCVENIFGLIFNGNDNLFFVFYGYDFQVVNVGIAELFF